jgi:hypothetical protein
MVAHHRSRERNRQQGNNCPGENRVGTRSQHLTLQNVDYH